MECKFIMVLHPIITLRVENLCDDFLFEFKLELFEFRMLLSVPI